MIILRELLLTAAIGLGLGEGLIRLATVLQIPLPINEGKELIFVIGITLFSLTFRLFWSLREEEKTPQDSV